MNGKYYFEFSHTDSNNAVRNYTGVIIDTYNPTETAIEVQAGDTPIIITGNDVEITSTTVGSSANITLISPSDLYFSDLYHIDVDRYIFKLYEEIDGTSNIIWSGFLASEVYEETYDYESTYPVTITVNDGFEILNRYSYSGHRGTDLEDMEPAVTVWELVKKVADIMLCEDREVDIYVGASFGFKDIDGNDTVYDSENPLEDIRILASNFQDELGEADTFRGMLDAVLESLGLQMIFNPTNNSIYVYDTNYILAGSSYDLLKYEYPYTSYTTIHITQTDNTIDLECVGGDKTLQFGNVYKELFIYSSPYTLDNAITWNIDHSALVEGDEYPVCVSYTDEDMNGEYTGDTWSMKEYDAVKGWVRTDSNSSFAEYYAGGCTYDDSTKTQVLAIDGASEAGTPEAGISRLATEFTIADLILPTYDGADVELQNLQLKIDLSINLMADDKFPGSARGKYTIGGNWFNYWFSIATETTVKDTAISVFHNNDSNVFNEWYTSVSDDDNAPLRSKYYNLSELCGSIDEVSKIKIIFRNQMVFDESNSDYVGRVQKILIKDFNVSIVSYKDHNKTRELDGEYHYTIEDLAASKMDDVRLRLSTTESSIYLLDRGVFYTLNNDKYSQLYRIAKYKDTNGWIWLEIPDMLANKYMNSYTLPNYIITGIEDNMERYDNVVLNIIRDTASPYLSNVWFRVRAYELDLYNGLITFAIEQQNYDL